MHTDQWRYERDFTDYHTVRRQRRRASSASLAHGHTADLQVQAVRNGLAAVLSAVSTGAPLQVVPEKQRPPEPRRTRTIVDYAVEQLKARKLKFSAEDPDAPENWPRVWFIWRGNALLASAKGHEYFLKHYLGTHNNAIAEDMAKASYTK